MVSLSVLLIYMSAQVPNKYRFPFAKYPAVRIALLFASGIITGYHFDVSLVVSVGLFLLGALLFFSVEFKFSGNLSPVLHRVSIAGYLLLLFMFGIIWQKVHEKSRQPESADILQAYTWEEIEITGTVYNIKPTSTGKYQLDIAVDTTTFGNSLVWVKSFNMRTVLDPEEDSMPTTIKLGSRVDFTVTIYPLEERRNPHQFNYKAYLASHNIFTQAGLKSVQSVRNVESLSWHSLRQWVLDQIEQNFDSASRPLAKALLIGYKNELDREQKIAFSRAGLSHIMAVSGLHVGFIIAPFWILIPWFWTLRYGKQVGLLMLIILLVGYAGLTGFSASVCRASLTGGLITYGKLFHKIRDSINLTAVAAVVLLLVNPHDLFTPGFQLSFFAVYIILLVIPVINGWLPVWVRYRWYGTPVMIVVVSILVQVGLFPLLTYHFGEFSLIGPLANAIVVPWLGIVVPYALFLLPVSALLPMASLLNLPNQWFLNGLQQFINWISQLEWSWIQIHLDSPLIFLIWIAGVFVLASLNIPRMRWKMVVIFLSLLVLESGNKFIKSFSPAKLTVTFFDVGQGDAALVSTPSDKHFLIDAGRWTPAYNSARYIILPHLRAEGIEKLDAIFLSHPHADHIGGITELIHEVPIDTIYNSGYHYSSQLYQNYHKLARQKEIPIKSVTSGQTIPIDPSILVAVYGPAEQPFGSDPNEHSVILEIVYNETEFLFMGDAGKKQEQLLTETFGRLLDTDLLKAGHHGSKTSSSALFLQNASPLHTVVSLAKRNRFRHPHLPAVQNINKYSDYTYFTSLQKALVFSSDGTNIRRIEW